MKTLLSKRGELEIDTYNDYAWISIVPFWMSGIRFRGTPAVPYVSQFPELNVRSRPMIRL